MYLLEPVANVTEIAQAKSAASARRASHVADNTDEIASLDRVSAPPGDRRPFTQANTTRSSGM